MIKYEIIRYSADGYGGSLSKIKLVKKSELQKYLDNDWFLRKKIIPIVTPFTDWWNKFSTNQKIAILAFILPTLVAVFFGSLAHRSNKENDSLKIENKTLNENYNQLKQTLILTSDSLETERKKSVSLKQQLTTKTLSDKNPIDKNN